MIIEANVAGITFAVKDRPEVRKLVPQGPCELKHNPFIHPSDPSRNDMQAVEVWHQGLHIGFLAKGSNERKAFFECLKNGADISCSVTRFSYGEYDGNLRLKSGTFNDVLDGYLASVVIQFESAVTGTHYTINGKQYIRATKVSGLIDEVGFEIPKYLYNWMTDYKKDDGWANSHEEYIAKIEKVRLEGERLHDSCEQYARDGVTTENLPHGAAEFVKKFGVKHICSEHLVFNNPYGIAGRLDLFAEVTGKEGKRLKMIIDWKRGRSIKLAYMLQCAFYCKMMKADGFMVVLFGTGNKCGYSVKYFDKQQAEKLWKVFASLAMSLRWLSEFKECKLLGK